MTDGGFSPAFLSFMTNNRTPLHAPGETKKSYPILSTY